MTKETQVKVPPWTDFPDPVTTLKTWAEDSVKSYVWMPGMLTHGGDRLVGRAVKDDKYVLRVRHQTKHSNTRSVRDSELAVCMPDVSDTRTRWILRLQDVGGDWWERLFDMPPSIRQALYVQARQLDCTDALSELVLHGGKDGVSQFYEQIPRTKKVWHPGHKDKE